MDMNAFLASLTDEQRAALAAGNATPTPTQAKAKRDAKRGTAKPAPMPSDDADDEETVPAAVAAVKTKGSTLDVVPPEQKRTTAGPVLTETNGNGRRLPVSCVPMSVTFAWADGREQTLSITPKVFSTGSVGGNCPGKLNIASPDNRPLQVSLNLIYVKPKGDE